MAIRPDSRLSRTPPQEFRLCHNRVFLRDYERVAAERWLLPVAGARAGQLGYPAGAVAGLTAERLRSGRLLVNPRDRLRGGEQ